MLAFAGRVHCRAEGTQNQSHGNSIGTYLTVLRFYWFQIQIRGQKIRRVLRVRGVLSEKMGADREKVGGVV